MRGSGDAAIGDPVGNDFDPDGASAVPCAPALGADGGVSHGATSVFVRSSSPWTEHQELTPGEPKDADPSGDAVATDADTVFA